MKVCLDVIQARNDELEEQRTGVPKAKRLPPELQQVFGPNAYRAGPADFERLLEAVNG